MRFGVGCSGFQVEGGYNSASGPQNNWFDWEQGARRGVARAGIVRSGAALDFWNTYEHFLDRAVDAGCDSFRFSVEWARCEPAAGSLDNAAFERYRQILEACRARALMPVVALHHFAHPRWAGHDFWLQPGAPERFAAWVRAAVDALASAGGCRHWITLNELNGLAWGTYMVGWLAPGRLLATGDAVRALDHLLAAHVLAYAEIRAAQPDAIVSTNNHLSSVYELDRLAIDVLLARSHGVARHGIESWLLERRAEYYATIPAKGILESTARRVAATLIPRSRALPRAIASVYGSNHDRCLDLVAVDYYSPGAADRLRVPGHHSAGRRNWGIWRMKWDERIDPEGLVAYCQANHEPGLDIWIAENGLCNRAKPTVSDVRSFLASRTTLEVVPGAKNPPRLGSHPRSDGWDRVRYLNANLGAVAEARARGLPITAYFHWTLADDYEWGSYEPRYGLYSVDDGRWSDLDSFGGDAAGAYRRLATAMRAAVAPNDADPDAAVTAGREAEPS